MLSANAGSGKTSVLVERFVASVVEDGLRADQVLAITFTEKAAGELRARVRARLLELGEREAAREAEAAWITTFHGFCARILRAHAVAAGLDPALRRARPRRRRAPPARGLRAPRWPTSSAAPRADALDLAAAYTVDRLQRMVVGAHDALRSRGQTRPALPRRGAPADPDAARAALRRARARRRGRARRRPAPARPSTPRARRSRSAAPRSTPARPSTRRPRRSGATRTR